MHTDTPIVLTTVQIAKKLLISDQTVRAMCEKGHFPGAFRISAGKKSHWRVPLTGLGQYMRKQAGEVKPEPKPGLDMKTLQERLDFLRVFKKPRKEKPHADTA